MKIVRVIEYEGEPEDVVEHLGKTLLSLAGPIVRVATDFTTAEDELCGREPGPPKLTIRLLEERDG